MMGTQVENFQL